jgi:hypothetical protein
MNDSRQRPVMLQLVVQGSQPLDDALALLALLLVGDIGDGAVQVVDCACLLTVSKQCKLKAICLPEEPTRMTGHLSWDETEAKVHLSEVKYWAAAVSREAAAETETKTKAETYGSWGRAPWLKRKRAEKRESEGRARRRHSRPRGFPVNKKITKSRTIQTLQTTAASTMSNSFI